MSAQAGGTVRDAIELMCRWNRNNELIVDGPERWNGERLQRESRALGWALREFGLSRGDRVAFIGSSSGRFYAAYFGAQKLGCTTCNIHPRESVPFLARTLAQLDARLVICSDEVLPKLLEVFRTTGAAVPVVTLGDRAIAGAAGAYGELLVRHGGASTDPPSDVTPADPAIIILSSGSTGTPKGIVHSNANFVCWLHGATALFGHVSRSTRFLVIVGTSFAAWPFSSIPVIYAGGTIVLMEGFEPDAFCRMVQQERITMVGPVPTMIRMLDPAITQKYDLSSFRMMLCAGEPPSEADIRRIRTWADTDIRCLYTASESAPGAATYWELRDQLEHGKPVCAGKPVPGADVRIVDPDGGIDDLLPAGESGEILLRGPTIAIGYLDNPELTAKRFVDGWWRSGDLGRLDTDGYLTVEGRTDNTINSGGIKVQGEEVELCLIAHPQVLQAAVIGVADERWGQRIEAHLKVAEGTSEQHLRAHCEEHLAPFKRPKTYVFHDSLPVGTTGKLDRVSLRRQYALARNPESNNG